MARPIYETRESLESEKAFAKWAVTQPVLKAQHVVKLPVSYRVDFAVYSGTAANGEPKDLAAFIEYKDRSKNFTWTYFSKRGGYKIGLSKIMAGLSLIETAGVLFHLAVKVKDGIYIATLLPDELRGLPVSHGGRKDRRVYDPQSGRMVPDPADTEPMVCIPCEWFNRWGRGF